MHAFSVSLESFAAEAVMKWLRFKEELQAGSMRSTGGVRAASVKVSPSHGRCLPP